MSTILERAELDAAELSKVAALVEHVHERKGRPGLGEEAVLALRAGAATRHFLAEQHGNLAGYALLHRLGEEWALEYCLSPAAPDPVELGTALVRSALSAAQQRSIGAVQLFVLRPSADDGAIARRLELQVTREIHEMRRRLPLEAPLARSRPMLVTRGFVVGRDEDALLEVNAAAFAAHPEQGAWGPEELAAREALDWFDPEGIRLAEEDGALAGFCWTKVHREPERRGEIYVIGVAPGFQGRGLGRGLVVAGLEHLAGRGETTASLYVEADNSPALGLYRSLGFAVAHTDRIYAIETGPR